MLLVVAIIADSVPNHRIMDGKLQVVQYIHEVKKGEALSINGTLENQEQEIDNLDIGTINAESRKYLLSGLHSQDSQDKAGIANDA